MENTPKKVANSFAVNFSVSVRTTAVHYCLEIFFFMYTSVHTHQTNALKGLPALKETLTSSIHTYCPLILRTR